MDLYENKLLVSFNFLVDRLTELNDAKQKVIADINGKMKHEIEKQECDL